MTKTKTDFRTWVIENLSESLLDIAANGADAGYSGIIYTNECVELHDKYEDELWEMLYEDAKEFGFDNVAAFMATFQRKDMLNDISQMKNLIVWYAVEKIAHEMEAR